MRTLTLFSILTGCYQENLAQIDIPGKLLIPKAAATRTVPVFADDGTITGTTELTDVRFLGPIYIGAFSGIDSTSFTYPHPAMGPVIGGLSGDAFPYGATSVGRFDFACEKGLACLVTTGRFETYDSVIDYFNNILGNPVTDLHGDPVLTGSELQQQCYEYYYATSDAEISFVGPTDFTETDAGDFEADFVLPHTTYIEGMAIWGYMDAPAIDTVVTDQNGSFSTCNASSGGRIVYDYDQTFNEGATEVDAINVPSNYLRVGDWVTDGETFLNSPDEEPTLNLNFPIVGE